MTSEDIKHQLIIIKADEVGSTGKNLENATRHALFTNNGTSCTLPPLSKDSRSFSNPYTRLDTKRWVKTHYQTTDDANAHRFYYK